MQFYLIEFVAIVTFTSITYVAQHVKVFHKKEKIKDTCSGITPVKIFYYRDEEALCILKSGEETAEWIDVESLDVTDDNKPIDDDEEDFCGFEFVYDVSKYLKNNWTTDTSDEKKEE